MKKKILFLMFIAMAVTLNFSSCIKDVGPVYILPEEPEDTSDTINIHYISYSMRIQPIWDKNCILCHTETHPTLNLKEKESWNELLLSGEHAPYVDTIFPWQSLLIKRLNGEIMPTMPLNANPLPQSDIDSITLWIKQGARNN